MIQNVQDSLISDSDAGSSVMGGIFVETINVQEISVLCI